MMQHDTTQKSPLKGLRFLATSIWGQIRKPTTQLMASMMLLSSIPAKNVSARASEDLPSARSQTKMIRSSTLQAIFRYDYGDMYKRGVNPQMDYVLDTAKTSAGLVRGTRAVKGKPLSDGETLNKLMRNDTAYSMNLYRRSYEKLQNDLKSVGSGGGDIQLHAPLKGDLEITSGFGGRKAPVRGASTYHPAVDLRAPAGTQVYNVSKSKLVSSSKGRSGVGVVTVDLLNEDGTETGYRVKYLHINPVKDKPGTIYESGTPLTKVSLKDRASTGPHLDLRIQKMNPETGKYHYINAEDVVLNNMIVKGDGKTKKQLSPLAQEVGREIAGYILGDKKGDILARLPRMAEEDLRSGKITQEEYEKRIKGIGVATNTLRTYMRNDFIKDRENHKKMYFARMDEVKNLADVKQIHQVDVLQEAPNDRMAGAPKGTLLMPDKDEPSITDAFAETRKALAAIKLDRPMVSVRHLVPVTA